MTLYPYLDELLSALSVAAGIPIKCVANIESIPYQETPAVFLMLDRCSFKSSITDKRTTSNIRFLQHWTVAIVLKDSNEQIPGYSLVTELGEWQATIVNALCKTRLSVGGPIALLEIAEPESMKGGFIAGRITFSTEFVFISE